MAVKPANSKYHTFTFNGVRAADYGIYVTDVNVFNSAARDVEYIEIPGRDGAFALDRGRFQNISVVYKCAMTQDTDEDFATAISEFRNAIASTKGYKRLEDDINTDEYRMGVFSKGLDAPTLNTKTATFDVEFNCQPQRWLKSGETAVSVTSGGQITNPTLFESHPLLQVWGYGDIGINGETISIADDVIGNITIRDAETSETPYYEDGIKRTFSATNFNYNDTLELGSTVFRMTVACNSGVSMRSEDARRVVSESVLFDSVRIGYTSGVGISGFWLEIKTKPLQFYKSSEGVLVAGSVGVEFEYRQDGTVKTGNVTVTFNITRGAEGDNNYIQVTPYTLSGADADILRVNMQKVKFGAITGYSTKSALGEPLYFDLDIGEAYKIEDGQTISVNNAVSFPAQLPVLKSGANTITYDDTVNQFKVVPHWWEV